ncbi:MAG: hypothetical protein KJ804_22330 [Proteobacteria bacterium]|nr:hypothetical protein [Pseudomonadota bacterium]MBU1061048.1 hypothetical protein [Pseudomonadota bacterium]
MSNIKDKKTDQRQLTIIDFFDSLPGQQQTAKSSIIQFPVKQVSKSRKKALDRVIDYANSLNW